MNNNQKIRDMTSYKIAAQYQQKSAEVRALQIQAYNTATEQLKLYLNNNSVKKNPAVVLDLDETVINNLPLVAKGIEENTDFTLWGEEWQEWVDAAIAESIPGAKDFLSFANNEEVKIFYISNREVENKKQTIDNLKKLKLPQVSEETVLLKGEIGTKENRRSKIRENYDVVLLIGNSLYDLSSDFIQESLITQNEIVEKNANEFGKRFILLPNSSYGDYWVNANLDPWE